MSLWGAARASPATHIRKKFNIPHEIHYQIANNCTNVRLENQVSKHRQYSIIWENMPWFIHHNAMCPLKSQSSRCSLSRQYAYFYANGWVFLPDRMPAADPNMACKQIVGEESSRARRMRPPVQGLSQPYTWPTPAGTDRNSCKW